MYVNNPWMIKSESGFCTQTVPQGESMAAYSGGSYILGTVDEDIHSEVDIVACDSYVCMNWILCFYSVNASRSPSLE